LAKTITMIAPQAMWPQVAVALEGSSLGEMEVYGLVGDYSTGTKVPFLGLINAGYLLFATPREWDETWEDARRLSTIALRLKATGSPEIIRTR